MGTVELAAGCALETSSDRTLAGFALHDEVCLGWKRGGRTIGRDDLRV